MKESRKIKRAKAKAKQNRIKRNSGAKPDKNWVAPLAAGLIPMIMSVEW